MTPHDLDIIVRGLAPVLAEYLENISARLAVLEVKERGLDGKEGALGPEGPAGSRGPQGEMGAEGKPGRDGTPENITPIQSKDFRTVTFCYKDGAPVEGWVLTFPVVIYQGVYKAGEIYVVGDMVTYGNQQWIAKRAAPDKPGDGSPHWQLSTRQGRDGKQGPEGKPGLHGKDGAPGRDGHKTW